MHIQSINICHQSNSSNIRFKPSKNDISFGAVCPERFGSYVEAFDWAKNYVPKDHFDLVKTFHKLRVSATNEPWAKVLGNVTNAIRECSCSYDDMKNIFNKYYECGILILGKDNKPVMGNVANGIVFVSPEGKSLYDEGRIGFFMDKDGYVYSSGRKNNNIFDSESKEHRYPKYDPEENRENRLDNSFKILLYSLLGF